MQAALIISGKILRREISNAFILAPLAIPLISSKYLGLVYFFVIKILRSKRAKASLCTELVVPLAINLGIDTLSRIC